MKRRTTIILSSAIILAGILIFATFSAMRKPPKRRVNKEDVITVPVMKAENKERPIVVSVIGKLSAKKKVEIYAEVSGIMKDTGKDFLEGIRYSKGELMIDINSDETAQTLKSRKSDLMNLISSALPDLKFDYPESYQNWLSYLNDFNVEGKLAQLPEPVDNREKFFISSKNIYKSYYDIESMEVRLSKYRIYVPYEGIVTMSAIKPGTLVRVGQKLGEYVNINDYELEVAVSLKNIPFLKRGDKINLQSDIIEGEWQGQISRINNTIDDKTQTVSVYISVSSANLKEGMYLKGDITTSKMYRGLELPRKLLIDSNYIYAVEGETVKKQEVEILQERADVVIVKGVEDGTLISRKTKNIHNGLKVNVAL